MMVDSPALDVSDVTHRFGARTALDHVSLRVERGAFTALLGPNGAGKTTLFAIITRLYNNKEGQVRVFGRDLQRESSLALAEMGVVFQKPTLDGDLSVRQNLNYHAACMACAGARPAGRSIACSNASASPAAPRTRCARCRAANRVASRSPRSLVHGPRLLLLDEATVGLDLASRSDIVRIVRDLVREEGLSVLWSTHIFDEVEASDKRLRAARRQDHRAGPIRGDHVGQRERQPRRRLQGDDDRHLHQGARAMSDRP